MDDAAEGQLEEQQGREARARRAARRAGLRALKSRQRKGVPNLNNRGAFMLLNENNGVVAGDRYDLSTEDVIEIAERRRTRRA